MLEGIITPSGLHYERHHNGVPDIDPATHRLLIYGLVERPLEFSIDALMRYPRVSRIHFMECGGNSGANSGPNPPPLSAGGIHGLLSCSEWTGVLLGPLLDEAGIKPGGTWMIAESGDAAGLSRSIPLEEARAHGILALLPEWRTPAAGAGLSLASADAGLGRQSQHQMAAPAEGDVHARG